MILCLLHSDNDSDIIINFMHKLDIGETIVAEANHSRGFTMGGGIGELTIPTGTLVADNYSVEVYYSEVGYFHLKAGDSL